MVALAHIHKLLICSLTGVLLTGAGAVHALQVTLDRSVVPLNETVRMELRSNYSQDLDKVDLSAVQRDFDIAGSSSQSEFSMVNGRTESVQKLTLTLVPTAVGEFQIPALQHKGRTSDPLSIKVVPAIAPPDQLQDQSIRIEAELDKSSALVNEQVIYTFRVIYRIDLNSAEITKLNVPGAQVEALPEANFQRTINGQTYQVVEKRYALFFAEAGSKTIAGQQLSAVIGASRNRFGFGFGLNSLAGGKQIKLGAEPLQIDIKAVPASERGKAWLPAQSVELLERWSSANDNAVVGQPLTRSIEILAKGASGEQLPAAATGSVDNLNSYPEKPAFTSEPWHGGIAGKRIDTYALIPTQAGRFTLPEVEVHWWNTQTGRAEVARLPARSFSVAAAAAGEPAANTSAARTATDLLPTGRNPDPGTAANAEANATQDSHWRGIALFTMAGWLLSLLALAGLIIRLRRKLRLLNNSDKHAGNNAFGTAAGKSAAKSSAALQRKLVDACRSGNPQLARSYLDQWLRRYAQEHAIKAGDKAALLAQLGCPALQQASEQLDHYLFAAQQTTAHWNGAALREAIATCNSKRERAELLPPLYPAAGQSHA